MPRSWSTTAISPDESGVGVFSLRAGVALAAGEHVRAARAARLALAEVPRRSDLWVLLGRVLEAGSDWEEAKNAFAPGTAVDPDSASAGPGSPSGTAKRRPATAQSLRR